MSQAWTDNNYQQDHVYSTNLQNMENNFTCLKSLFSGASAPSSPVAGMPWLDTSSGTNLEAVLKLRNGDNDEWFGLMHGDVSEKRLVYRDAAMEGYARDSGVTDKVIALKGGAIYTTGAATAGSFSILTANIQGHEHTIAHTHNATVYAGLGGVTQWGGASTSGGSATRTTGGSSVANSGPAGGADGLFRPAAAVCILEYLDL